MKKIIALFILLVFILSGCNNTAESGNLGSSQDISNNTEAVDETAEVTPIVTEQATSTPTSQPTPQPTAIPDKPKYIFIVIGDGMGQGAASLGEMYARIEAGDMDAQAEWESFEQKRIVEAMSESSSGGTALATGCKSSPGHISMDIYGDPVYTIMDRANEAGFATGVISNSSLADATPATFTSHTASRYNYYTVLAQTASSNVDYLAGGGLRYFASKEETANLPLEDCYGIETYYGGSDTLTDELLDCDYNMYYGMDGAKTMLERIENKDYPYEKAIYPLSLVYMPWEIEKYKARIAQDFETVPSLCDMTKLGIETLSQNPNGFVMMVEEAFIDKAAHYESQIRGIYQMKLLNDTMKVIMDFCNEHPYETLVVLTADHETGNYLYNEELFNEFKELPAFVYADDGDEISGFLINEWEFKSYESYYYNQVENAQRDVWENEEDARVQLYASLTETASVKYGTIITTAFHSSQDVPLYATGNGSGAFENCEHIAEVPIKICEIMGWNPLPEVMPEELWPD